MALPLDGIVIEGDAQHYAMQMPYYLLPDVSSAEAVSDFSSQGYFVLAPNLLSVSCALNHGT